MSPSNREKRALDRFAAVSAVAAMVAAGMSRSRAIAEVTKASLRGLDGDPLEVSPRTLHRWVVAYEAEKFAGLLPDERPKGQRPWSLPEGFVDFMVAEKALDEEASIPEIIERAVEEKIIKKGQLSRVTVWRAACRLNLPIFAGKLSANVDQRRFEHEHRMKVVLCDGKHFRAGPKRARRLVFFFLDDATRKVLLAIVGPSERPEIFLVGLARVLRKYGKMKALYLDRGSAFIAKMSARVCAGLDIKFLFGRARYPAGHGKIERYNRTCGQDLLRGLSKDETIDPTYGALELRINHYVDRIYNVRKHSSLPDQSPDDRWDADDYELEIYDDFAKVEPHFIVTTTRRVTRDNVVMLKSGAYEMPRGYRGKRVWVFHRILEGTHTVLHDGRHVVLAKVDLHANARARRVREAAKAEPPRKGKIRTAAQRRFDKDHSTVVDSDGGFPTRR